jgi:ABC-type Fe3+/spermidine/putrescine transport system ATPase subunit
MPKVTLKGISNYILKDLSLEVHDGEFLVLLGPNGAGKSTLLNAIAGLTGYRGAILFDDKPVDALPASKRRIGYLFQHLALFPHMDVKGNIGYGLRVRGEKNPAQIEGRIDELMTMMQIGHLAARYPKNLSGGEKQRVALARVLAASPDVLLMDEPLSSLDLRAAKRLRLEIRHIQRSLGITAIYVTHNFAEATEMADRIAVIEQGRLMQIGSPAELLFDRHDDHAGGFIGRPNIFTCGSYQVIENGLAAAECGRMKIIVPHDGKPVERIAIAPEHVYVSTEEPLGPHVNRFDGTIREMRRGEACVRASIEVCGQLLEAELAPEIADMMNLSEGSRVHIILKLRWLQPLESKGAGNDHL